MILKFEVPPLPTPFSFGRERFEAGDPRPRGERLAGSRRRPLARRIQLFRPNTLRRRRDGCGGDAENRPDRGQGRTAQPPHASSTPALKPIPKPIYPWTRELTGVQRILHPPNRPNQCNRNHAGEIRLHPSLHQNEEYANIPNLFAFVGRDA